MNNFTFNSFEEFGLFLKINSEELKDLAEDEEKKTKLDECLKFLNAGKGGCPCNYEKRKSAAQKSYRDFVPLFFTDNTAAIDYLKDTLNNPPEVHFKSDSQDVDSFFSL